MKKYKGQLQIGSLDTKKAEPEPEPAPAPAPEAEPTPAPAGEVQPAAFGEPQEPYGDLIPFADPSWYQGVSFFYENQKFRTSKSSDGVKG